MEVLEVMEGKVNCLIATKKQIIFALSANTANHPRNPPKLPRTTRVAKEPDWTPIGPKNIPPGSFWDIRRPQKNSLGQYF
jgi:hypothetical protein